MVRKYVKALVTLSIIAVTLVGCGKAEQTGVSNEIGAVESTMTENTEVAENETEAVTPTPTEEPTEAPTPTEEPTPVPTEEPTPEPTEAPTPEPTEEPTPTPEPVHEHSYTETIIVEGTCTTWGTKRYTCSCGDSYEKEYALDHVSDGNRVMVVEPNCATEGISAEHCIYCGERLYAELASGTTGHVPKDHWEYFTHTGNYYLACSICNRVIEHTTTRPEGAEIREITPVDSNTLQPVN
ncbi:MAG: hypothetical protein IJX66_06640 [Lachnospiraceae bacterium]|nr:hypothetical protein [Lachnospiraceae bacterium]